MINKDFSEYPEHRVEFFKLLKAINLYCFPALLKLDGRQFKFVIDSCMWASKHDNREVENTGLSMCNELMDNMAEVPDQHTSSLFFQQFFVPILQDVFFVLTDPDHKSGTIRRNLSHKTPKPRFSFLSFPFPHPRAPKILIFSTGFKSQSMLLARMFYLVESGRISEPVYTAEQAPIGTNNKEFLRGFVGNLLRGAFANLQPYVYT